MRSRDHNSTRRAKLADGEGKHRCGTERIEDISTDSRSCKNARSCKSKLTRVAAVIVRDDNTLLGGIRTKALDILGKTEADSHNGVDVHSSDTRAENTSHTAGAEFKLSGKTLGNSIFVILYRNKLCLDVGRNTLKAKPTIKVDHILFGRH